MKKYPNLDFIDIEQGSPEWFAARIASVSVGGSEFKSAVAKGRGGAPSKTRTALMQKKIREQATGEPETWGKNSATKWGHYYEGHARQWFEDVTGLQVALTGMIKNKLYPGFHTSPDGVIVTPIGLYWIEIKCPQWKNACKYIEQAANPEWVVPAEYRLQCRHHSIIMDAVGGFFISYYPEDKAVEILGADAQWQQIVRYVPGPSSLEKQEHIEGMKAWSRDLADMQPKAKKIVADYQRDQQRKQAELAKAVMQVGELNNNLIERISQ